MRVCVCVCVACVHVCVCVRVLVCTRLFVEMCAYSMWSLSVHLLLLSSSVSSLPSVNRGRHSWHGNWHLKGE